MEENQNKSEETFSTIDEIEKNAEEVKTKDDSGDLKIKRERLYSSEEFTAPSGGIGIKIKVKKPSPKTKKNNKKVKKLKTLKDQANLNISPSHSPSPSSSINNDQDQSPHSELNSKIIPFLQDKNTFFYIFKSTKTHFLTFSKVQKNIFC